MNAYNSTPVRHRLRRGLRDRLGDRGALPWSWTAISPRDLLPRLSPGHAPPATPSATPASYSIRQAGGLQKPRAIPTTRIVGADGHRRFAWRISFRPTCRSIVRDSAWWRSTPAARWCASLATTAPEDGNSVVLTINVELQEVMARGAAEHHRTASTPSSETTIAWPATAGSGSTGMNWRGMTPPAAAKFRMANSGAHGRHGSQLRPRAGHSQPVRTSTCTYFDGGVHLRQRLGHDPERRGNNPLYNRCHLRQGHPRLHLQAVHRRWRALAEGDAHAGRAHQRRGRASRLTDTVRSRQAAGPSTPQDHQNQTARGGPSRTPATTYFYTVGYRTRHGEAQQMGGGAGPYFQDQHRTARRVHQLRGQPEPPSTTRTWPSTDAVHLPSPCIVANAIRADPSADRRGAASIEYDDERVDAVVKKPAGHRRALVQPAVRVDRIPSVRGAAVRPEPAGSSYIASNYMVNTMSLPTCKDLYWTANETIMLAIGQSITQVTPIAVARYVSRHRQRRHGVRRADRGQDHRRRRHRWCWIKQPVVANQIDTDSVLLRGHSGGHGRRDLPTRTAVRPPSTTRAPTIPSPPRPVRPSAPSWTWKTTPGRWPTPRRTTRRSSSSPMCRTATPARTLPPAPSSPPSSTISRRLGYSESTEIGVEYSVAD